MIVLTEQIEIPASYEKLKAWTANFEEEFVKWSPYHIECISGATPDKVESRMNELRESLCAVNMVSLAEAMAYQEMGEAEAARVSLQYYASYIQKTYLAMDGFVERLDMIDPSPENYWSQTLPKIKDKIHALPCNAQTTLLEEHNDGTEIM